MRLLNSYTLEFHEFDDGNYPPYAILSHTWGSDEILYKDMTWLQDYHRLYESNTNPPSINGKSKNGKEAETVPSIEYPSAPGGSSSQQQQEQPPQQEQDEACPEYSEAEESSTEEQTAARELRARHGYEKILKVAEHARVSQIGYFWIDTCCIDKSSSAEVSEAVISAHRIYKEAAICFIYLADVPAEDAIADRDSVFRRSWWFTRGWTLIELLAPTARVWFNREWDFIFPDSLLLSEITGIEFTYLEGADYMSGPCVAKKLSWAAYRSTTRKEDTAYCLMGLFDIAMSVLYGEGAENAFLRLQRKIVKKTADVSTYLWGYESIILGDGRRTFALSPDEFAGCRTLRRNPNIEILNESFASSPRGLELRCDIGGLKYMRSLFLSTHCLIITEILDERTVHNPIILPVGTYSESATPGDPGVRMILYRLSGARPVRISRNAGYRLQAMIKRLVYLKSDVAGNIKLHASQVPTSLDVLFAPSLSSLPFRLVEIFPPPRFSHSAGGFVSFGNSPDVSRPVNIYLRYEESGSKSPSNRNRRRFAVVLEYNPVVSRAREISVTDVVARVVDCTSSNLLSFMDQFNLMPAHAERRIWARYPATVTLGDSQITASILLDADRRGTPRLVVNVAPLELGAGKLVENMRCPFGYD